MAVKPKYRNKGIGKKLLNKCIEFSNYNGYESIILYSNKKLKMLFICINYLDLKKLKWK